MLAFNEVTFLWCLASRLAFCQRQIFVQLSVNMYFIIYKCKTMERQKNIIRSTGWLLYFLLLIISTHLELVGIGSEALFWLSVMIWFEKKRRCLVSIKFTEIYLNKLSATPRVKKGPKMVWFWKAFETLLMDTKILDQWELLKGHCSW